MNESQATLAISLCDGIGPKTFQKLIRHFGSAKSIWENLDLSTYEDIGMRVSVFQKFQEFKKSFNLSFYINRLKKAKVFAVTIKDALYPETLKKIEDPPIVLYCKGNPSLLNYRLIIGVVGARKITSYGKEVTERIVRELVAQDFVVVSGLAFGVDAVSHSTTLSEKGKTIAVLGCGVDCCTPLENQGLYEEILDDEGLIVSEYFLGHPPSVGSFPARNRIIAGLTLGVLVTEAAEGSGSLITAQEAIKQGKSVFAVPGPINSFMSKGTFKLLQEGAHIVSSGEDILQVLNLKTKTSRIIAVAQNANLNSKEKKVVMLLEYESMRLDILAKVAKIPMVELMVVVSSLEMQGFIQNREGEISLRADIP